MSRAKVIAVVTRAVGQLPELLARFGAAAIRQ
jgi:hypothetical protein